MPAQFPQTATHQQISFELALSQWWNFGLEGASPSLASNPKSPELPFGEFIHLLRQWVFARISALAVLTLSRLAAAHHDVVQVQA